MTASAIRGDREKCLNAGMNNYLAKPVRADTLKQMLESYLNQPTIASPNLQRDANELVNRVLSRAANDTPDTDSETENRLPPKSARSPERPKNARHNTTEIRLTAEEMAARTQTQSTSPEDVQMLSSMQKMREQMPSRPKAIAGRKGASSGDKGV